MENKESPQIGIEEVQTTASKERALNARNPGGETVPAWPAEQSVVETPKARPSTGKASRFPYETARKGVIKK